MPFRTSIPTLSLQPLPFAVGGEAANDSHFGRHHDQGLTDVNLLVATAVARVTAHMSPRNLNVVLQLAAGQPTVAGDGTAIAFAMAGVLAARLRACDEGGEHDDIHVVVVERDRHVRVFIAGHDVPPLGMVRALAQDAQDSHCDRTVAHCRRLVEGLGGTLRLGQCGDELAVELSLPACPQGPAVRMSPTVAPTMSAAPVLAMAC